MPRKTVIAVVGPDVDNAKLMETGEAVGRAIAEAGWVLLTGGRNRGVMDAASKGAQAGLSSARD
jgi:predicted Rossmann-fold nucleotide-binding protein